MKNFRKLVFLGIILTGCFYAEAQSNYTDNKSINSLLEKKRSYNKKIGTGFRIQLYNGEERRAKNIKQNFTMKFPGVSSELLYEKPEWKVQVGKYNTKIEADRALNTIKEKFSGAIVVPMKK